MSYYSFKHTVVHQQEHCPRQRLRDSPFSIPLGKMECEDMALEKACLSKQPAWTSPSPSWPEKAGAGRPLSPRVPICWVSPGMAPVGQLSPLRHPAVAALFLSKFSIHGKQETPDFFPSFIPTSVDPPDRCFPLVLPPPRQGELLNQERKNIIAVGVKRPYPLKEQVVHLCDECLPRAALGRDGVWGRAAHRVLMV